MVMLRTSPEGVALIKHFEGFEPVAYRCDAGVLTIGYGHTSRAGAPVVTVGMTVTEEEADAILRDDLQRFEGHVRRLTHPRHLHQHEFDALVSFVFNFGPYAFDGSTMRARILDGKMGAAADEFGRWVHAGGVEMPGLVRRRKAERAMFLGRNWREFVR